MRVLAFLLLLLISILWENGAYGSAPFTFRLCLAARRWNGFLISHGEDVSWK